VALLFGRQYVAAATTLPVLLLSAAFMWFSHVTAIVAIAARLQENFLWIQGVCAATYFALNRVAIGRWGVMGACEVRLLAMAMAPVLTYWVLERRAALTFDARILRRTLGAAAAMVAAILAFRSLPLYFAGPGAIAVYGAVLTGMHVRLRTSAMETEMGQ
jgi:O-antigen/teichoic acid export membrane protein